MSKQVEISLESFKELWDKIVVKFNEYLDWLTNFFSTIDQNEMFAAIGFGLGFLLFIVGLIII